MIELSVIIPMYNASKYIIEAIESILNQTGIYLELIIINDGSTDNSIELVDKYNHLKNVKIYNKNNGGAGSARNLGLKKATCKYVMFLDADDFLSDLNICYDCIKEMEMHCLDIAVFSYKYRNTANNRTIIPWIYPNFSDGGHYVQTLKQIISNGIFPASPCYRIIKRQFLVKNNIYFREGHTAEDIDWFIKTLINIPKIKFINRSSYVYRKENLDSITNKIDSNKCEDLYLAIKESISIIAQIKNTELKDILLSAIAYQYCILLSNIYTVGIYNTYKSKLNSIKFLFNYTLFPKVKYISIISQLIPLKLLAKVLHHYRIKYAKSNA